VCHLENLKRLDGMLCTVQDHSQKLPFSENERENTTKEQLLSPFQKIKTKIS